MARAFIDLHCHTRASFDCLSDPVEVVRLAAERGLTHIAITDHDRIDGALAAREAAPDGLTVIVGEEVKTADGDLICVFLERVIPPGLTAVETIAEARAQGALVGIPHPFDSFRGSLSKSGGLAELAPLVDWIEGHNARLVGKGNEQAVAFAAEHARPIVAVSDAHSLIEVGVAYTSLDGDPSTPAGLLAALSGGELIPGRATYFVRLLTPVSKIIQRVRGNGRVRPSAAGGVPPGSSAGRPSEPRP
jgi:predicted metal-dependent phosphoesterase TrpH